MRRVMNWKGFGVLVVTMLLVFFILHGIMQGRLAENKDKQTALQIDLTREQATNNDLTSRLNEVGTLDYIVKSARENYAFISKNEMRFEFENPEALYNYTEKELQILMEELVD